MEAKYRIQNENGTSFGAGRDIGSWFTLERARVWCDYGAGQRIVEIDPKTNRVLWEVF